MDKSFADVVKRIRDTTSIGTRSNWREIELDPAGRWLHADRLRQTLPNQGWKLHISSTAEDAEKALKSTLPLLFSARCAFKIAASMRHLHELNGGRFPSQVGKFITIYPESDDEAVRIAEQLATSTRGLRGPEIPTDRAISPKATVHYRYGAFRNIVRYTPVGKPTPCYLDPLLNPVPDDRDMRYRPPAGIEDPFIKAGLTSPRSALQERTLKARYILGIPIDINGRGGVYMSADLSSRSRCIIKEAKAHIASGIPGLTAQEALKREYGLLRKLPPELRSPRATELFLEGSSMYLVMEDIPGKTLTELLDGVRRNGHIGLPPWLVRDFSLQVLSILEGLHGIGFAHCDIKPGNLIVTPSDEVRLIDYDIHQKLGASAEQPFGTRGYRRVSARPGPVSHLDDIHSLGALMYYMITGLDPSHLNIDEGAYAVLPISQMRPDFPSRFAELAAQVYEPSMAANLSASKLKRRLQAVDLQHADQKPSRNTDSLSPVEARHLASTLRKTICSSAVMTDGFMSWEDELHPSPLRSPFFMSGVSGIALQLARTQTSISECPNISLTISGAVKSLLSWGEDAVRDSHNGLHVGLAGMSAALFGIARDAVLEAPELTLLRKKAADLLRQAWSMPALTYDLMSGTAGLLRASVFAFHETKDEACLKKASQYAHELRANAQSTAVGGVMWDMPESAGEFAGRSYLGYAHGIAGIGDALLDFRAVSGEQDQWTEVLLTKILIELKASSRSFADGGVAWPRTSQDEEVELPFWCHGAAGIGMFLARCSSAGVGIEMARAMAIQAAHATLRSSPAMPPIYCHGLAGSIVCLSYMYNMLDEPWILEGTRRLGAILKRRLVTHRGSLHCPGEAGDEFASGYMTGLAGVVRAFELLAGAKPDFRSPLS